ncbi:SpoIIE family protein phosphatase [Actinomadura nitritigenes]|uniref:SpoIIE family protein phosphatase n=1 Tax=Actinomadura nitritigenes TaxID=134602 RepID=A0ABS3RDG2_9ACTN|nr:SpoIIE family protein phosphatase [Actinomadura nitritigenes]MBO2444267.1 SpoIIE family protein phosphatase [Actinomadura nitritigenes]
MTIAENQPPLTGAAAAPPDQRAGARPPRFLDQPLLGVVSMAAFTLNEQGRINHWNHAATELFGAGPLQAAGRSPASLLRLPQEHRGAFEPEVFGHVWCGACMVPRADDGRAAEVGWWVYPIEPDGDRGARNVRVLALAADLRRLREDGPGLAMDGVLVAAPDGAARRAAGARLLRVEPVLAPPTDQTAPDGTAVEGAPLDAMEGAGGDGVGGGGVRGDVVGGDALTGNGSGRGDGPLARRLAELLPAAGAAATEAIVSRVLALGQPAVSLSVTVRLPVVPHIGDMPRALRIRPRAVSPHTAAADHDDRDGVAPAPSRTSGASGTDENETLTFLSEAGQQIGGSLDHLQAARTLAEVLVPRVADFAAVELLEGVAAESAQPSADLDETAVMRRVAVAHNDEPGHWEGTVPEGETLVLGRGTPFVRAMRTGRAVHVRQVDAEFAARLSTSFGGRDLSPLLTGRDLLIVPLIARGRVLGTFKLLRKPDRPGFDDLDLAMVDELARRAALCVDNGRLYRREVQVAQELQRSMLPADPPEVPGARVHYRYRPAGQAAQVGGDWFDAFPLPGRRLGIVVGDVMGHGLTSAAIMGQMRTAVRTLAVEDMRPDLLLRQLDALARRLGEGYVATCLYAVYDPVARRCSFANAGHVPPVLVSDGGESRVLPVPAGLPIGVGGEPFETMEIEVEDGSRLVLCTDGLLERRDRDIDQGLEELRALLAGPDRPLDATCDALLDALATTAPADDIAIVAVGLDGIPKDDVAVWELEPEPSMVSRTRAQVAFKLAEWRLDAVADTVQLLVSELVTNALLHGAGAIVLRLIRGDALLCEVYDDGQDMPHLRHADATAESGRGLHLVSHIAACWGTHRTDGGKVVWFEHRLPE